MATVLAWAGVASAQEAPPGGPGDLPPVFQVVDANGVNLSTGKLVVAMGEVSIGQPDQGGLTYSFVADAAAQKAPFGRLRSTDGVSFIVNLGAGSEKFIASPGGGYTNDQGSSSSLLWEGVQPSGEVQFAYTTREGVTARYLATMDNSTYFEGRIVSLVSPAGETLSYSYNDGPATACNPVLCRPVKRVRSISSNLGYQLRFNYDDESQPEFPTQVTAVDTTVDGCDPDADTCAYSVAWPSAGLSGGRTAVDALGRLHRRGYGRMPGDSTSREILTRPSGARLTVTYGSGGRVSSVNNGVATWSYSYTGTIDATTITNPQGVQRTIHWLNRTGLPVSDTLAGRQTTYEYDSAKRLSRLGLPDGRSIRYGYDARGNLTETRRISRTPGSPADIVTRFGYEGGCSNPKTCNKPLYRIDERGAQTDFVYDPTHGGLLRVTGPAPTPGAVRPEKRFSYSAFHPLSKNSAGQLVASPTPVYRMTGTSTCMTAASCSGTSDEARTTVSYDVTRHLLPVSQTAGSGDGSLSATTTLTYDVFGNVLTVDGPLPGPADTERYHYDAVRQLRGVVGPDPDGAGPLKHRAVRYNYTPDDQVDWIDTGTTAGQSDADWSGFTTLEQRYFGYDTVGRLVRRDFIGGGVRGEIVQYSYDSLNRVECEALRMNPSTYGALPGACTLTQAGADGPDRITRYTYNAFGEVTRVTKALGTAQQVDESATTYNASGTVATLADARGNLTTYEYDGFERLVKLRFPDKANGAVSSSSDFYLYGYDAAGNRTYFQGRNPNQAVHYAYDALNRLTHEDGPSIFNNDASYTYDNLGNVRTVGYPNHALAFAYDALGRMTGQSGPLGTLGSAYDAAGRRIRLSWPDGFHVTYEYAPSGEMTAIRESGSALLASFAHDDLGRRTHLGRGNGVVTTYGYDLTANLTRLVHDSAGSAADQTLSFTYNIAGQLTSRGSSNDAYVWTGHSNVDRGYGVNPLNQLVNAGSTSLWWGLKGALSHDGTRDLYYDHYDRLFQAGGPAGTVKLEYDPLDRLAQLAAGTTTRFAYDGPDVIAEYDSAGRLLRRYVHGPVTDEPLVWYEGSGTGDKRWFSADERGSVTALTNSAGTAFAVNTYDEYGVPGLNQGRFQYTGQMWIPELGLYHYKARAYSPTLGRFLQPDPLGYQAGMNLYAYVSSDPVNLRDPLGLDEEPNEVDAVNVVGKRKPKQTVPVAIRGSPAVTTGGSNPSRGTGRSGGGSRGPYRPKCATGEYEQYSIGPSATLFAGVIGLSVGVEGGYTVSTSNNILGFQWFVSPKASILVGAGWYAGAGLNVGGGRDKNGNMPRVSRSNSLVAEGAAGAGWASLGVSAQLGKGNKSISVSPPKPGIGAGAYAAVGVTSSTTYATAPAGCTP